MKRSANQAHNGVMRRLMLSLVGYTRPAYSIGAPRRAIDREEQEYSPLDY